MRETMRSGRFGWLAAIAIPLALLVGLTAEAWHEDHDEDGAEEHECAVCHAAHQSGDLPRPVAPISARAAAPIEPEPDRCTVRPRRSVRRPARAPPR